MNYTRIEFGSLVNLCRKIEHIGCCGVVTAAPYVVVLLGYYKLILYPMGQFDRVDGTRAMESKIICATLTCFFQFTFQGQKKD